MRIGIEAQRIFRKKKHGMDMVALELIRNLQKIDKTNEYFIFVKPDEDETVIQETENFRIIKLEGGAYPFWEQYALPQAAKKYGCQLLHCTSNTAPLFGNIPLILTLHDIIYMESSIGDILRSSGSSYQNFGNIYRKMLVPQLIKKSKKIITVSDFEKKCISDYFKLENQDKIVTVYNGAGDYFKPITDPSTLNEVKERYGLPEHFFFFLGNTHPKKNTKGTLKAYSDFLKQSKSEIKLVMIDFDRIALKKILAEIGDPDLINHIVLTGYIANTDLPAIYSLCELFLYPSLRESFGIPVIEAMASGTPVITSNTSSMPEVAGNAALLVNPYNTMDITTAMIRLTKDQELRSDMKELSIQQASGFSWQKMAEAVLAIYQQTANESGIAVHQNNKRN